MATPKQKPKEKTTKPAKAEPKATDTRMVKIPKPEKKAPEPVEVLPPEKDDGLSILKHPNDAAALNIVETSIKRDIQMAAVADKAGAMLGIKIGLALNAAKMILRHGQFENWVSTKFGSAFGERKARYYYKMGQVFISSAESGTLQLPAPREAGQWLVVSNEGSELQKAVEAFVGDMTFAELLDKHKVRPFKQKGGWRPAEWLLIQYQQENPRLKNKPFEVWSQEDKDAFKAWQEKQVEADESARERMAAEGTWGKIRAELLEHGLDRKSWKFLLPKEIEETRDTLAGVLKAMSAANKNKG